ncbi:hypothetical protein L228DRAFT_243190 [Xylona heveae TC161]|uniref:Uncharacterized protein n=1 Tax=Xylona heveae (strain CBS 132557 / TC161) TaxID=1328760 RepID=A0A165JVK9_XYLHT|nr:hypothetical protein L228DRAFT_243190 [Xylona heveae TC161]KZF26686.1 hypothetical protein L228DRAFT_243190 [Xylona heveae TC161]
MSSLLVRLEAIESRLAIRTRPRTENNSLTWRCWRCRVADQGIHTRNSSTHASPEHEQALSASLKEPIAFSGPQEGSQAPSLSRTSAILNGLAAHTITPRTTISQPAPLSAKDKVFYALRNKQHKTLLKVFLEASKDEQFIQSIPPATLTEILRMLDPDYFVEPIKELHEDLSTAYVRLLGIKPLDVEVSEYMRSIRRLTRIRRRANHPLDLTDYTFLLKCARAVGDSEAADGIWLDMMRDKVQPNTTCYNYYLAARCWAGHAHAGRRHKLRVMPYNMAMRQTAEPLPGFEGFRVKRQGIRSTVFQMFNEMVQQGVQGDERTFTLLMTAMGREGDMDGVKSVLKKAWNVDVDALLKAADESTLAPVVPLDKATSALYPGDDLLFAIAHIFGSNNDIPTAIRLVDYIARQYEIDIPLRVWAQLFEWTFVLSTPRSGERRHDGPQIGQLPLASVSQLWETMTSPPYNVRPNVPMYNRYVKNLYHRQMLGQMLARMEEGIELYSRSVKQFRRASNKYRKTVVAVRGSRNGQSRAQRKQAEQESSLPIESLRFHYEMSRLVRSRNHQMVRRWMRLLLGGRRWSAGPNNAWERTVLPDIIEKWRSFMPERIEYNTSGGRVEFDSRPEDAESKTSQTKKQKDSRKPHKAVRKEESPSVE